MKGLMGWLCLCLCAATMTACAPVSYTFSDFEGFKRPGTDAHKYKRVAVLYVGGAYASSQVKRDMGSDSALQTEATAFDDMFFSNALLSSFTRRGVEVVERNRINDLMREQGVTNSEMTDLSDLEKLQRLGKMLKVDLLVKGAVFTQRGGFLVTDPQKTSAQNNANTTYSNEYFCGLYGVTLTAIDTRTGELVWVETRIFSKRVVPSDLEEETFIGNHAAVREMIETMVARFYNDTPQRDAKHQRQTAEDTENDEDDEFGE